MIYNDIYMISSTGDQQNLLAKTHSFPFTPYYITYGWVCLFTMTGNGFSIPVQNYTITTVSWPLKSSSVTNQGIGSIWCVQLHNDQELELKFELKIR